jgi:hypothetical protein
MIVSDHGFQSSKNRSVHIGVHDFDGIYLVAGPGVRGGRGPRAAIEDVAPTALYLLDLPVGEDMTGSVIGAVRDAIGQPVESIPTYEDSPLAPSEDTMDESTIDQIRGLGYLK